MALQLPNPWRLTGVPAWPWPKDREVEAEDTLRVMEVGNGWYLDLALHIKLLRSVDIREKRELILKVPSPLLHDLFKMYTLPPLPVLPPMPLHNKLVSVYYAYKFRCHLQHLIFTTMELDYSRRSEEPFAWDMIEQLGDQNNSLVAFWNAEIPQVSLFGQNYLAEELKIIAKA